MIRSSTFGLVSTIVVFAASPVASQEETILQPFRAACNAHMATSPISATLPATAVLDLLLQDNDVPWSGQLVSAYTATVSGDALIGDTLARTDLASVIDGVGNDLLDYRTAIRDTPSRDAISATGRNTGGLSDDDWVDAYLGGQLDLLQIHCPPAPARTSNERRLIVTGDIASLSRGQLGQREFATISYTNNRETSVESFNIDVVLGAGVYQFGSARWIPYVSYERQSLTSAPINDLTFGAIGFWRGNYHELRWAGEYETDDQFESAVFRASLDWDPPALPCGGVVQYPARIVCRYGLRFDYVSVDDPGSKVALANTSSFLRAGGWAGIRYGRPLLDGWFQAALDYELMEPLSGDEGDAARVRASLSLSPSQASHYEFGLAYENGEDITSLVRSEIIKLTLGVRY